MFDHARFLGTPDLGLGWCVLIMAGLSIVFRVVAYLFLRLHGRLFGLSWLFRLSWLFGLGLLEAS